MAKLSLLAKFRKDIVDRDTAEVGLATRLSNLQNNNYNYKCIKAVGDGVKEAKGAVFTERLQASLC